MPDTIIAIDPGWHNSVALPDPASRPRPWRVECGPRVVRSAPRRTPAAGQGPSRPGEYEDTREGRKVLGLTGSSGVHTAARIRAALDAVTRPGARAGRSWVRPQAA